MPPDYASVANRDLPAPLGGDQVTTQPPLVAAMVEALELTGEECVLEVATGLGYRGVGRLAREVWSVERRPDLAAAATADLAAEGAGNVHVIVADGSEGVGPCAPYEAIVVAAAHPLVPPPLAAQLAPGGRPVQLIRPSGAEDVTLFRRRAGRLVRERVVIGASFVPLYGRHRFASSLEDEDPGHGR
ncbi:MAG: protein-L-isoaspartate(D-aspartate) O-methyltransferase [Solirubrobacteraceae bacterium]|nr:protein-L-isoaspartate(D-aspartate) O-methyltransferase [Solirubrobacteraceae bacterium]